MLPHHKSRLDVLSLYLLLNYQNLTGVTTTLPTLNCIINVAENSFTVSKNCNFSDLNSKFAKTLIKCSTAVKIFSRFHVNVKMNFKIYKCVEITLYDIIYF